MEPYPKAKFNVLCALALGAMLIALPSCDTSAPPVDGGLTARSVEMDSPSKPVYEVLKDGKRVALVTFDWVTNTPGTGGAEWNWHENGSTVTITVEDPEGVPVKVTLTEADEELSASGDVDRAKIDILQNQVENEAEQDAAEQPATAGESE